MLQKLLFYQVDFFITIGNQFLGLLYKMLLAHSAIIVILAHGAITKFLKAQSAK